jgi:hypothetical protein
MGLVKSMATVDEPLKNWGLSHSSQKGWRTYYTLVTFGPNKKPDQFLAHVRDAYNSLSKHVGAGNLRLVAVSITFGIADAVVVWQAKSDEVAKEFRDLVLAGNGHHCNTVYAMDSGTHR